MTDGPTDDLAERLEDLEVKLAFQDKLIKELDALVRTFGDRLDKTNRELEVLKQSVRSPETPLGPANEPPPHY
jgi:SlyX protein